MTDLPTYKGARVVAHTTDHPTRRVFENDGFSDYMPWRDTAHLGFPSPLRYESSALLDPVPVPYNPKTGEHLCYVPTDATIPAGATYHRTAPTGFSDGPFELDEPYPPAMRDTRNTYWTVDPIPDPEPEPEAPAGPSWWDVLTDDQRARLESLSGEQAGLVADLIQHKPGESTMVGNRGILPALRTLTSEYVDDHRYGLVLLLDAFLGGDL